MSAADLESILLQSRNRFRAFVDAIPDAMCVVDSELRIVSANAAYAVWHDRQPRDVIGQEIWLPGCEGPFYSALLELIKETSPNSPRAARELRVTCAEEGARWFEIVLVCLEGDEYAVIVHEITAHKELAERLERERADVEALEAERLRRELEKREAAETARREQFHMIVHDLKSPLAQVIANLEMLEDEELNDLQQELVEAARMGADDMGMMIGNLLDVERLEGGRRILEFEAAEPDLIIQRIVGRLRPHAELSDLELEIDLRDGIPPMVLDISLFERVLRNLLMNAIEHSPPRGRVCVAARFDTSLRRLIVAVDDEGPGVAEEDRRMIFEKFRRGRNSRGAGLGLAFCKSVVLAHHGSMRVEPGTEKGSRFIAEFPLLGLDGRPPREGDSANPSAVEVES